MEAFCEIAALLFTPRALRYDSACTGKCHEGTTAAYAMPCLLGKDAVSMPTALSELARLVGGVLCGDGERLISGAATLQTARPGEITLADHPRLAQRLAQSPASAVVVTRDFPPSAIPHIVVDCVHASFAKIVRHFRPPRIAHRIGVSSGAFVSPSATIEPDVDIYPGAYIGDAVHLGTGSTVHSGVRILPGCRIGQQVTLFPNVVLYEDTVIGDRCILHAGAIIGAYGFGYTLVGGRHQLSAQLGNVEIAPDVEIGACTTIDRGTYGPTVIGEGTKIDNQVMIAHNCQIGRHNLFCSHVGIAGSSTTGDYVVMAGQVGVGDHIRIGNHVTLGAKAGVMHDIADGESHVGIPSTPLREQMIKQAALAKLPEMRKQLKELQRKVDDLTELASLKSKEQAA